MLMANELKVSPVSEETADAERQTKDAWCGSRGSDWWLASVASMDAMASMASVAWWRRVASSAPSNDNGAACFVDFGSTENHQCE